MKADDGVRGKLLVAVEMTVLGVLTLRVEGLMMAGSEMLHTVCPGAVWVV